MKRIGELPRPGERPKSPSPPARAPNLNALVDAVQAEIRALGERTPPDVAANVNMLVGLASQNGDRRAERLQQALTLLRAVPR